MQNNGCRVCQSANQISTVTRHNLITMQNYVYPEFNEARNAQVGQFELLSCKNCGFSYNSTFDSDLLTYDENYDNSVPSSVFAAYYKEIASFLYNKFSLKNGFVIDVGCGKGTFLKLLCSLYPDVQGLGIDPSYESHDSDEALNNLDFIKDIFKEDQIIRKPSLIICRHVLEHIEYPVQFLQSIHSASKAFPGTPFFIEVPDLEWILENGAFWDFCYEHCNYFTVDSLKNSLKLAGFNPETVQKAFNGQYLWAIGKTERNFIEIIKNDSVSNRLISYSQTENSLMAGIKSKLEGLKSTKSLIVVWGMATKGVLLCNLIDSKKQLFDYCIDINPKKSGCFVPYTGHKIDLPEILAEAGSSKLIIVVMNPNYISEIQQTCQLMNLDVSFIDANGNDL